MRSRGRWPANRWGQTALMTLLLTALARPAHAYLDPGTGSYVFQMVMAAVVSGAFLVKTYWRRLVEALRGRRNRRTGDHDKS